MPHSYSIPDWQTITFAAVVNAMIGVLYLWGLFLLPLETATGHSRAELSLVAAIALVGFTIGVVLHSALLRLLGFSGVAVVAFLLAGGGHLLFAVFPVYPALIVGYGIAFGVGSGIGYGLALALASSVENSRRGLAIGIVMASFALSGILLPLIVGSLITSTPPSLVFGVIGAAMLVVGLVVYAFLRHQTSGELSVLPSPVASEVWLSRRLITLGTIFFSICFVGLMAVAHGTAMAAANGLSSRSIELMPTTLMLGYLSGSLFGGKLVETVKGPIAVTATSLIAFGGLWFIDSKANGAALLGASVIGATFGASASLMPMVIGEQYGRDQIGPIYSKLIIAYGLAGLLAPWTTGLLFGATGSYRIAILIGMGMCILSALLGLTLKK